MNKTKIRELLEQAGIAGVVTTRCLAEKLGISVRTVNSVKNKGQLRQIDRNTFDLDSIVEWLYAHPRYIARLCEKH